VVPKPLGAGIRNRRYVKCSSRRVRLIFTRVDLPRTLHGTRGNVIKSQKTSGQPRGSICWNEVSRKKLSSLSLDTDRAPMLTVLLVGTKPTIISELSN
jgi:hypothetical protein